MQAVWTVAARRYPGVKRVSDELSEFSHFGASGVWVSWTSDDSSQRSDPKSARVTWRLGPGWRDADRDPLLAAAMLSETAQVVYEEGRRFVETYLLPLNRAWNESGGEEISAPTTGQGG